MKYLILPILRLFYLVIAFIIISIVYTFTTTIYLIWNLRFPKIKDFEHSSNYPNEKQAPFFTDLLEDEEYTYFFKTYYHYIVGKYYKTEPQH